MSKYETSTNEIDTRARRSTEKSIDRRNHADDKRQMKLAKGALALALTVAAFNYGPSAIAEVDERLDKKDAIEKAQIAPIQHSLEERMEDKKAVEALDD